MDVGQRSCAAAAAQLLATGCSCIPRGAFPACHRAVGGLAALRLTCKQSRFNSSDGGISACHLLFCLSAWLLVLQVKVVSCHPGWTLTEGVEAAYGDSKRYLQPLRSLWQVGVACVGKTDEAYRVIGSHGCTHQRSNGFMFSKGVAVKGHAQKHPPTRLRTASSPLFGILQIPCIAGRGGHLLASGGRCCQDSGRRVLPGPLSPAQALVRPLLLRGQLHQEHTQGDSGEGRKDVSTRTGCRW